ncbi:helix-turn-helix domain-containing protein [Eubacterium sp.]|uniref:helix-turn-helix domain-containing protein n=1 Tax=Eubacterium sp. TaxID=142586 RepID=UPI003AB58230
MGELFLGTQLVKLMKASICRYDASTGYCQNFGEKQEAYMASEEQKKILEDCFQLQHGEYPNIYMLESDILVAEISHEDAPNVWNLFGPIILAPTSEKRFTHANKKYHMLKKAGLNLQICELDTFVTGILLCFYFLTGRELSVAEFWAHNKESMPKVIGVREEMAKNLFRYQEKGGGGLHNPYEQEQREQEAIRHGDIAALNRSISETYEGQIGRLAKDSLRHHKNVAVGNITLASRTAVEAGVSVEKSFTMADNFIQQIEEIDNVVEVEAFKREAQRLYAEAVAEEQKTERSGYKNPLVGEVKDYIFRHFHDSIQITDIAKHLNVNPDYLSHLFKKQENITIKRYILREKIRRSRNLLQYSDYSIQEISFYLGFSSQSHFCKVFQEMTGETPGRYRKQFVHRTKWKIV